VHNLHGMPGLLGGLIPVLSLALAGEHGAAYAQLAAVGCALALAIAGGAAAGWLVSLLGNAEGDALLKAMYEDTTVFKLEEDE
jgi:ammonium transporter Rh